MTTFVCSRYQWIPCLPACLPDVYPSRFSVLKQKNPARFHVQLLIKRLRNGPRTPARNANVIQLSLSSKVYCGYATAQSCLRRQAGKRWVNYDGLYVQLSPTPYPYTTTNADCDTTMPMSQNVQLQGAVI